MPQSNRKLPIERPPSKIAGMVYVAIGFMAFCISAFVLLYRGENTGPESNLKIGFAIVIAFYGLFRIFTGISMVRKANHLKDPIPSNGQSASQQLSHE